jgi:predicted RNase H-like nuclease (RuvC/YqgF family)
MAGNRILTEDGSFINPKDKDVYFGEPMKEHYEKKIRRLRSEMEVDKEKAKLWDKNHEYYQSLEKTNESLKISVEPLEQKILKLEKEAEQYELLITELKAEIEHNKKTIDILEKQGGKLAKENVKLKDGGANKKQ